MSMSNNENRKPFATDEELNEMIKTINKHAVCALPNDEPHVNRAVIPIYESWEEVLNVLTACGYRVTVESFENDNKEEHFRDMILTWEDK